mgnify:CR=1 FL=1
MDNNLIILVAIVFVVLLCAAWLTFWSKKNYSNISDEIDDLNEETESNLEILNKNVLGINDLLETYKKVIDEKNKELNKYKEGGELLKHKGLFISLIDILDFINKFSSSSNNLDEKTKTYITAIHDKLDIVLTNSGVEYQLDDVPVITISTSTGSGANIVAAINSTAHFSIAGKSFNTWPKMGDSYIPENLLFLDDRLFGFFDNSVFIHFFHRALAYLSFITILYLGLKHLKGINNKYQKLHLLLIISLVFIQLFIGVFVVLSNVQVSLGSIHQIIGDS